MQHSSFLWTESSGNNNKKKTDQKFISEAQRASSVFLTFSCGRLKAKAAILKFPYRPVSSRIQTLLSSWCQMRENERTLTGINYVTAALGAAADRAELNSRLESSNSPHSLSVFFLGILSKHMHI